MKVIFGLVTAMALLMSARSTIGAVVYSDDFNRASLGSGWTTTVSAGDGGASIVASTILQLSNDATGTANANGRVFTTVNNSTFSSPFNQVLNSNPGVVTWSFNLQQIRSDPSGFDSGGYGAAFVLGGTSSDFTIGDGYAVAVGNSGSTDPLRLVRYTGGLDANSNLTNIISGTAPVADISANFYSIKVTYNPSTNGWEMFARDDGASAFADPISGVLTSVGTVVDNTFTGSTMTNIGALWNYSTAATQAAQFDNVVVDVVPEPSTIALGSLAGLGFLGFGLRRNYKES